MRHVAFKVASLAELKRLYRGASGPPPVIIVKPIQKEIVEWDVYTVRTDAVENVNITPRVSGYMDNITFRAGDMVNKWDLLFVIDPRPFRAVQDQAEAQLRQAQANQQLQDANFARQDKLRQTGVIAREDFDTALSNKNQAAAQVLAAQKWPFRPRTTDSSHDRLGG
jgi:RND family efflux transporter MFP subunit